MCGAGLPVRCWGGSVGVGVRRSRALESCSPGAAATHAGLSGGGSLRDGVDLAIDADEFFGPTESVKSGAWVKSASAPTTKPTTK